MGIREKSVPLHHPKVGIENVERHGYHKRGTITLLIYKTKKLWLT